jgi:phytanoyl-CoA hydroxylase
VLLAQQISQFHTQGFLRILGLFSGRELEELQEAVTQVNAEALAGKGEGHLYQNNHDGTKTYFRSEKMWARGDIFQAVTVNPHLLECVGQCMGHPFIPINNALVNKMPEGNVPIRWHQDPPYPNPLITETYEVPHFTVDIYLDRSTIENGCVWGIPRHHLVGHIDLLKYTEEELFMMKSAVPIPMEPGDVLFHCLSSPHGSVGNITTHIRRTLYLQYGTNDPFFYRYYIPYGEKKTVREMLEARWRLGLCGGGSNIRLTSDGEEFEFIGEPRTPPRHWRTLKLAMSEDERIRKRHL